MNTIVYIRDVNNLSDARYCAAMGVDFIGFRLDPSKEGSLSAAKCKEILGWISGVKVVGEFGDSPQHVIDEILRTVPLDYLLAESVDEAALLSPNGKPLIIQVPAKALSAGFISNIQSHNPAYLLVTSDNDEEPIPMIADPALYPPMILGFGITPENTTSIAAEYGFAGLSLVGGSEERPGYKDYDEMAEILDTLEATS